ncbi:MAG TPA: adenylyl-sulfate kinase [Gammaproteobacteria bacterium]|nr:adenylyl-sulfate kinase [Gammaproteobacteria bacterium]
MNDLIAPCGGTLIKLLAGAGQAARLKEEARSLPAWTLSLDQQMELEALLTGAFSPLRGYMGAADYEGVLARMRLADGTFWPVPLCLDIDENTAGSLGPGSALALRDLEGVLVAVLRVAELWRPDPALERGALGNGSPDRHPVYVGGAVEGVELPPRYSFNALRRGPAELRAEFRRRGWTRVAAWHSRTPLHAAQRQLALSVARENNAELLVHPQVVEGNDEYYRVRCYRAAMAHFPEHSTLLSLLFLPLRAAGMRDLVWQGIVRQNFGCAVVGMEDDGTVSGDELRRLAEAAGLSIRFELRPPLVYVESRAEFMRPEAVPEGESGQYLDEQELRRRLAAGLAVPQWFSYPEVLAELAERYPPPSRQGFTLFFTGLSGAGKSTIAKAVEAKLLEQGGRPVSLLDGDVVRTHLSSELGFSKEHRNLNIQRIGYVASEITKNGGAAICAPIAPYAEMRRAVRRMISRYGGFIEVHVATPLDVCEGRDRKGLYALARAGKIKEFTGISDPYEEPENPELRIDTSRLSVEEAAQSVLLYLEQQGYIA